MAIFSKRQSRTVASQTYWCLLVTGTCVVQPSKKYYYGNVNIVSPGVLIFEEAPNSETNFWASSIIIENGGKMSAGESTVFGTFGGVLTIHLYGADQSGGDPVGHPGQGVLCQSTTDAPCGIPSEVWTDNVKAERDLPGKVHDVFYQYGPLYGDDKCTDGSRYDHDKGKCGSSNQRVGYFGYKVLAVSYGGTLVLHGHKGASYSLETDQDHVSSGGSWMRLAKSLNEDDTTLQLEHSPGFGCHEQFTDDCGWKAHDKIVVTTTDYLPGHSEELTIKSVNIDANKGNTIDFDEKIKWPHNGVRYGALDAENSLKKRLDLAKGRLSLDRDLVDKGVETRAAVALLSRSIRIVSGGDKADQEFPASTPPCTFKRTEPSCYSFGAHMVIRQGFEKVQIQGVEFKQMGQGGRLAHYPVHFHMARKTPADTYIKDSSVNESMTRWFVIHSTQGVTLARNVGYKSIGHGYYLEDATETDNNFYSNIGIFARAAVDNEQNPRKVPGILAYNGNDRPGFPFRSDNEYPSVFWITNGWNDFIGNMAAGAGTCGACYWLEPAENSDMPDVPPPMTGMRPMHMKWSGYAALQRPAGNDVPSSFAGATPLKSFYKNYCTSAMHSFQTTQDAPACNGLRAADLGNAPNTLSEVKSIAPTPLKPEKEQDDPYYPHYIGERAETRCPLADTQIPGQPPAYDCSAEKVPGRCSNGTPDQCGVTVLDHYTSAFNWAENGVAAIWLRPKWYLVDNSVLSDVQNAGLTFVTSGTYDRSAVIEGDWALARNTVFIGNTQKNNPLASNAGPFNQGGALKSPLKCDNGDSPGGYCLNSKEGISMPLTNFAVNQRLFNIYDGPAYEDSNVYLDITKTPCNDGKCMYADTLGIRKDSTKKDSDDDYCYLPNAAIAWKQPNGFFYPPAFHSTNLFFDNVDIRHYVIDALFQPRTYINDLEKVKKEYCKPATTDYPATYFGGFTDIDRQTELNDDDGSLTGLSNSLPDSTPPDPLKQTISVNPDKFFNAPVETAECKSNLGVNPDKACGTPETPSTATTSPYDYVTTAVISECGVDGTKSNPGRCGDDRVDDVEPGKLDRFPMQAGRSGIWSQECTNPACYGVPLYRQFLTGEDKKNEKDSTGEWKDWYHDKCDKDPTTPQCRWPFVRMGGQAAYQRSTLTVNHGTYYLDTTVPRDIQWGKGSGQPGEPFTTVTPCQITDVDHCHPRSVNVFEEDKTYYVYFLYAKRATKQTYQIYVGRDFDLATVKAKRAVLNTSPVNKFDDATWPAGWDKHYNDKEACPYDNQKCGILKVTVDFKNIDLDLKPANGLCLPHTFCSEDGEKEAGKSCGCALKDSDPLVKANPSLKQECKKVCGTWAVKDLDFPRDGAWGFSFKLPSRFNPDATIEHPTLHRPQPESFPKDDLTDSEPNWLTTFKRPNEKLKPDSKSGGTCYYPNKLPPDCSSSSARK
jgi:cell migration-inducing and hyaluronan-binding protein